MQRCHGRSLHPPHLQGNAEFPHALLKISCRSQPHGVRSVLGRPASPAEPEGRTVAGRPSSGPSSPGRSLGRPRGQQLMSDTAGPQAALWPLEGRAGGCLLASETQTTAPQPVAGRRLGGAPAPACSARTPLVPSVLRAPGLGQVGEARHMLLPQPGGVALGQEAGSPSCPLSLFTRWASRHLF